MPKHLVIVESPTKAKTIAKFLGKDFQVESSFGHVRDLPKSKMGVDIDHNFEPTYVIPPTAKTRVSDLKKKADKADIIYFATDEDREGEAISWHLADILKTPKDKIKRIVFHEITKDAILEALENPRGLDLDRVDAQQARRILDRLVGYELSPLLWKKVARGLSAGRVQSVAVRLIVEREREIEAFKPTEFWSIEANVHPDSQPEQLLTAALTAIDGKSLDKFAIGTEADAQKIVSDLESAKWTVADVEQKLTKKRPLPPFTTSTLQQAANNRLGFSAKQTMMLAQQLYEGIDIGSEGSVGLITYMRTDSMNLSKKFLDEAADHITTTYGKDYSTGSRAYKTSSKGAQEAHEAIRPTSALRTPDSVRANLDDRQFKLYQLIWQRAVASQMADAGIATTRIDLAAGLRHTFRTTGSVIRFDGFLKVYPTAMEEAVLPELKKDQVMTLTELTPNQHFTQPPARYSEATLVKAMEQFGIGRPSTYAPTISTVQERGYVEKEEKRLKPTEIGRLVTDLLVAHFPQIVDYAFTAKMENDLDEIADGKTKWQPVMHEFWGPFKKNLDEKEKELSKKDITEEATDEVCDKCGKPMVIKVGRYGKFLACSGYPECKNTKPLGDGKAPAPVEPTGENCPDCGSPLVKRRGRYGEFVGCSNYPKCKYIKKQPAQEFGSCPKCSQGKIVSKRSRRGFFYGCDRYPDCDFALWNRPVMPEGATEPEKCPECQSIVIYGPKEKIKCSSKTCGWTRLA